MRPAVPFFAALAGVGCGLGLTSVAPEPRGDGGAAGGDDTGAADQDDGGGDAGSSDGGWAGDAGAGDGGDDPVEPSPGDLVLGELMINPSAVADESGEWLELANVSARTLDLGGLRLSDDDVDGTSIVGGPVVLPGGYAVICAVGSTAVNGGVDCDATYAYETTGGGFALANASDEVVISDAAGGLLDRFTYGDGFAPTGASMGVAPGRLTASGNDEMSS